MPVHGPVHGPVRVVGTGVRSGAGAVRGGCRCTFQCGSRGLPVRDPARYGGVDSAWFDLGAEGSRAGVGSCPLVRREVRGPVRGTVSVGGGGLRSDTGGKRKVGPRAGAGGPRWRVVHGSVQGFGRGGPSWTCGRPVPGIVWAVDGSGLWREARSSVSLGPKGAYLVSSRRDLYTPVWK